jgi:hypothetical protein
VGEESGERETEERTRSERRDMWIRQGSQYYIYEFNVT